jgi:thiamine monophosphate kinase
MGKSTLLVMTTSSLAATGTSPPTTTSSLALKKWTESTLKNDFCQVEKGIRGKRVCGQICRLY